jgi:predicted ester cyclase
MTRTDIEALLERHAEAFARRDPAELAHQHTPGGIFRSPAAGTVQGRPAIEQVYRYWFDAFPDMRFSWPTPLVDDSRAALFWTLEGTMQGAFFGVSSSGTRVQVTGAGLYTFADDGIAEVSHIFDFSAVLMKVGVLKAKPV